MQITGHSLVHVGPSRTRDAGRIALCIHLAFGGGKRYVARMKKQDKIITFLGKNTRFEGHLTFQGAIRIDGEFVGEIEAPEGNLIIGEGAKVESEIHVASVIISGEVRGNISADKKIEVLVPGKVTGNIQAPSVMVQEGVVFSGNCKTLPPEDVPKGKLALVCEAQTP